MDLPQQQHYVPRFLLKNFSSGKKPQVYAYDKSAGREFRTHIKNVAAERGFYDINIEGEKYSLEPGFSSLESNAADVIRKLARAKNLSVLDTQAKTILACLLAVQFVRTKQHRNMFGHAFDVLASRVREMGASDQDIKESLGSNDEEAAKAFGVYAVLQSKTFVPYFLDKDWLVFETTKRDPFFVSDHPITLHNRLDLSPYGNLGLGVKGIEIYMPLSSTLCLAMFCRSIGQQFRDAHRNLSILDRLAPGLASAALKQPVGTRLLCEGLVTGRPDCAHLRERIGAIAGEKRRYAIAASTCCCVVKVGT